MSEYWMKGCQCRTSRGRIYVRLNFYRWWCWYTKSSYFRFGRKTGVEIGQAYWKRLRNSVRGICSLVRWWNFKNYCISARPSLWPSIRKQSWFCQNRVMTVSLGQDRIDPAYRFFLCLAPLLYSSQVLVRAALLLFFAFLPSLKGTCMKSIFTCLFWHILELRDLLGTSTMHHFCISLNFFEPKMHLLQLKQSCSCEAYSSHLSLQTHGCWLNQRVESLRCFAVVDPSKWTPTKNPIIWQDYGIKMNEVNKSTHQPTSISWCHGPCNKKMCFFFATQVKPNIPLGTSSGTTASTRRWPGTALPQPPKVGSKTKARPGWRWWDFTELAGRVDLCFFFGGMVLFFVVGGFCNSVR